ncbi:hypothetical protein ACFYWP_23695 [Actinacidiphila glaucinigra]|uniref:hypothetical protein n=1 Tax=Actinacidiphila glaucinigra TaxID=235986 RepID=UPI00369BDA16
MTPQEAQDQEPTLELINDEIASRLARQSESGAKVDTKAVFLVGFAATAAQFLASRSFEALTGTAAFAMYAISIGFGISIFHLADYEDIEPRQMLDGYGRSPRGTILLALAATRVRMFEKNREVHRVKARRWTASLAAVVAGICLSTIAIMLHTDGHDRPTEPGKSRPGPVTSAPITAAPAADQPH